MRDRGKITKREFTMLSAYLDGELSSKDAESLEHRLATDPALKKAYEELKQPKHCLRHFRRSGLPDRLH